jgi:hypothetical protein
MSLIQKKLRFREKYYAIKKKVIELREYKKKNRDEIELEKKNIDTLKKAYR